MSTDTTAGRNPAIKEEITSEGGACQHPAWRVFAWIAVDGSLCAGCCDCGEVLAGEAQPLSDAEGNEEV